MRGVGRVLQEHLPPMSRLRESLVLVGWLLCAVAAFSAEPIPVMVQSGAGRFEIAAIDSLLAHAIAGNADEAWRILAGPLGLTAGFATPVYFRVVSGAGEVAAPFGVVVETGGVVSMRLRAEAATPPNIRRALVQGLLMRLAVAQHGVTERLRAPLWLEEACVGWWTTRSEAAQLDALKYESARRGPPALSDVLQRERGPAVEAEFSAASVWLLTFLQLESGRGREWPALLNALLAGEDPAAALGRSYAGRFASAAERELWWQTGWHHAVRGRTLPALDAADSRAQLGALARFVFAGATSVTDVVLPLDSALGRAGEPIVASDLARRANELSRMVTLLHPFYRNAGLSLAEVFSSRFAKPAARAAACAVYERDWQDAIDLDAATAAALDAIEAGALRR